MEWDWQMRAGAAVKKSDVGKKFFSSISDFVIFGIAGNQSPSDTNRICSNRAPTH